MRILAGIKAGRILKGFIMNDIYEKDRALCQDGCEDSKLLREINERLIRMERRQKTEQTVRLIVTFLVIAAILAVVLLFGSKITNAMNEIRALADKVEAFASAFEDVDLEKFKQTVQTLSEKFDEIDISELETALDHLKSIDLSGISSAIERINEFMSSLGNFSFGGLFG